MFIKIKNFAHFKVQVAILLIAISCGLSLVLSTCMLNFWLAKEQIAHSTISLFALINLPYCINFLWAPLIDKSNLPYLTKKMGHTLAWIFVLQIILAACVFVLGCSRPDKNLNEVAVLAFTIALLSSTYSSLANALRSEILKPKDQGAISGIYIFGYRTGMLIGGSGGIYASIHITWQDIYKLSAVLIFLIALVLPKLLGRISQARENTSESRKIKLQDILKPIGSTLFISIIFLFLILYRIPDNFITVMINPFLLDIGFTEAKISIGSMLYSSVGVMSGGILGGYLMRKVNIVQALWYFGLIHCIAHLFFILLSIVDNNLTLYLFTSVFEGVTGGMAMTAYISFITAICKGEYRATQQALFSSVMGISRSVLPMVAGFLVMHLGWTSFFMLSTFISAISLCLLFVMRQKFWHHIYG
ncbi:AmpG protein [Candidatus Phycorickettsia trachydisci]|uniref:AmpG protein n=1 Tax=Candidatus Phycorickettsia trachydisci TaxID=2115978 RepID=A0A2P1P6T6_9RICK|nr:MFS transporter [Candidatus Phycorickettsia trachydisci]AVP86983.1 AmpG protein [Candidatus Phycorickettsia trachydisci]